MTDNYIERILRARVYDVAMESPLESAPRLSRRIGNTVLLKREDLQPVFSFKLRGAYNKIAHLSESVAKRGVICASAGNHAQGVALAAQAARHPGDHRDAADHAAHQGERGARSRRRGGAARRRLRQRLRARAVHRARAQPRLRASVRRSGRDRRAGHRRHGNPAPVARRSRRHLRAGGRRRPHRRHRRLREVSQPEDQDHRRRAGGCRGHARLAAREEARRCSIASACSPTASRCKRVGEETFRLCREHVDEIVLVDTDEICAAIQDIFEDTRSIVEAGGRAGRGRHQEVLRAATTGRTSASSPSTAAPT